MTKAQATSDDVRSDGTPDAAEEPVTGEFPAVADEAEAEEAEDVFKEIPTVANRANPTASPGGAPAAPPEGVGAYRILRPTTSDVIETPAATKVDASSAKRVVIGAARKPR